ncbi:MAG: putative salt-induced outer membrane protein YdiY [Chlamydiales bacterium]|jgi:putative salt-induced outer membrane protein YdiY
MNLFCRFFLLLSLPLCLYANPCEEDSSQEGVQEEEYEDTPWKREVSFDLGSTKGNSETQSLDVNAKATHPFFRTGKSGKYRRTNWEGSYAFNQSNNKTDKRNWDISWKFEKQYLEKLSWFVKVEMSSDEFKNLDRRIEDIVGITQMFEEAFKRDVSEPHYFDSSIGISRVDDWDLSGTFSGNWRLYLGMDYKWHLGRFVRREICEKTSLGNFLEYMKLNDLLETAVAGFYLDMRPVLEKADDYILSANPSLKFKLNDKWNLSVEDKITSKSRPAKGKKKTDQTFKIRLIYSL